MSITGIKVIKSAYFEDRTFDFRDLAVVGAVPHGDEDKQCTQKWNITKSPEKEDAYIIQNTLTANTPETYLSISTGGKKVILSTTQQLWKIQPGGRGSYLLQLYDSPSASCSLQSGGVNHPVEIVNETPGDQEQWFLEDVASPGPQDIVGVKHIESVGCRGSFFDATNEGTVIGSNKHAPHIGGCSEKWSITRSGPSYVLRNDYLSKNLGVDESGRVITSTEVQLWDIKLLENGHYTLIQPANPTDRFCSLQDNNEDISLTKYSGDHQEWILTDVNPIIIPGTKYLRSVGHKNRTADNLDETEVVGMEQHGPHITCTQKWKITKSGERYVLLNDGTNKYLGTNDGGDKAITVNSKDYWNISPVHHTPTPRFTIQNERTKGFCSLQSGEEGSPVKLSNTEQLSPNEEWFLAPADLFTTKPCPTAGRRA